VITSVDEVHPRKVRVRYFEPGNDSIAPSGTLTGREARSQERFRELVAWYMLQGVDEATARRRAQDEIDDDPRKD
jgi:hypothetical protein